MEKFTGVPNKLLVQYRADFIDFLNNNKEVGFSLLQEQLKEFNDFTGHRPDNFIGAYNYNKFKYRLFESLFDTYVKIRLYSIISKAGKENKKDVENLPVLRMKLGSKLDEITTRWSVRGYRTKRQSDFCFTVTKNFDMYNDVQDEYLRTSKILTTLAQNSSSKPVYVVKDFENSYLKDRDNILAELEKHNDIWKKKNNAEME